MKNIRVFRKNQPYPTFDPDSNAIPGIPDWERRFGKYRVYFSPGVKKYKSFQECGDYVIHVSPPISGSTNFTNKALWKILECSLRKADRNKFLEALYLILNHTIEEEVYSYIAKSYFEEEVKVVLYALWHRAIVEDRIYPPPEYNGRKRIIGLTYALIRGKYKNVEDLYEKGQFGERGEFEKLYQQFECEMKKIHS